MILKNGLSPLIKMYSKSIKWIIALIAMVSFGYYMLVDELIAPELIGVIEQFNKQYSVTDNGSVYQIGMWASFDDDPYEVGLKIVSDAHNGDLTDEVFQNNYAENKWLREIEVNESVSPFFCDFINPSCIEFIWNNAADIPELLDKFDQYIERYDALISYDTFLPVTKPSFYEPIKLSELDFLAVQLKLLKSILLVKNGLIEEAVTELSNLIKFNRLMLESSYRLLPKVINLIHYKLNIHVASFLIAKTELLNLKDWELFYETIEPLTQGMLSMERHYLYEVVSFSNALKTMSDSELVEYKSQIHFKPLAWLLFKPNQTINQFYNYMSAGYNTIYFENGLLKERDTKKLSEGFLALNNYIGSKLVSTLAPRHLNIEPDLYELDFQQDLLRKIYEFRIEGKSLDKNALSSIISPYNGRSAFVKGTELCLETNDDSDKNLCVNYRPRLNDE